MSDPVRLTVDEQLDFDMLMFATAFELRKADGTRERIDPTRMLIHTRDNDGHHGKSFVFKGGWNQPKGQR